MLDATCMYVTFRGENWHNHVTFKTTGRVHCTVKDVGAELAFMMLFQGHSESCDKPHTGAVHAALMTSGSFHCDCEIAFSNP